MQVYNRKKKKNRNKHDRRHGIRTKSVNEYDTNLTRSHFSIKLTLLVMRKKSEDIIKNMLPKQQMRNVKCQEVESNTLLMYTSI